MDQADNYTQNFRSIAAFASKDVVNHIIMGSLALLLFAISVTLLRDIILGEDPGDAPLEELLNPLRGLAGTLRRGFEERGSGLSGFIYIVSVIFLLILTIVSLAILEYFIFTSLRRLRRTFFLVKGGSDALLSRAVAAGLAAAMVSLAFTIAYTVYIAARLPGPLSLLGGFALVRPLFVASITIYLITIAICVVWAVQHIHHLDRLAALATALAIFSLAVTWVTLIHPGIPISPLGPGGLAIGLMGISRRLEEALKASYGMGRASEANHVMRNSL
ncbi:hypothetical protein apy_01140 [Aeropyrum pernix]|uniref:Uncharacterized protein n=1 Tax=Aeropyrum pernix TaxID=56636 RepID=A0A401H7U8_AERPX|nr:hypothetical protein [Aeropyrum pernix]GBF08389.1 hypothetical protein apy_01140 [Aeropyrum pernix]